MSKNNVEQFARDFKLFSSDLGVSTTQYEKYSKYCMNYNNFSDDYINPAIIEERQLHVTQLDVFSRLMMDRIIFLGTAIDDTVGNILTAQLLFLNSTDPTKDIHMYINSPGGSVSAGLSIFDTMNLVSCNVNTLVTGMAASMGFMLTINGVHRSALQHSRLMAHPPSGGVNGKTEDILIEAEQIKQIRAELYQIISEKCNQPYDKVFADCEHGDYWMTAKEALDYHAIDEIVTPKNKK
jgi:ATP-dependent Clp protease protease subunit